MSFKFESSLTALIETLGEGNAGAALTKILDTLPVRLFIKDKEERYTFINQKCADAFHVTNRDDIIGKTDSEIFAKVHADETHKDDRDVLTAGVEIKHKEEEETRLDNTHSHTSTSKFPLRNASKDIIGLLGIAKDREKDPYRMAVESAGKGVWFRSLREQKNTWYSTGWKEMFGYKPHELGNTFAGWSNRIHADDYPRVIKLLNEYMADKDESKIYECEYRLKNREGAYVWIQARGKKVKDHSGQYVSFAGTHTNVTEERKNRKLQEKIFENLPCFVFVKDENHRFTFANSGLAKAYGMEIFDIKGRTNRELYKIICESDFEKFKEVENSIASWEAIDSEVIEKKTVRKIKEEKFKTAEDKVIWLATTTVPIEFDNEDGTTSCQALGVSTDITELKKNRDLLAQLNEVMTDSIFIKDLDGRFVFANRELAVRLGLERPDELVGKTDFDVFDRQTAEESHHEEIEIVNAKGEKSTTRETTVLKTGAKSWRLVKKVPIKDSDGQVILIAGIEKDVTEYKKSEITNQRNLDLLEKIFDNIPQCIWIKDLDLNYVKCNKKFAERRGCLPSDIVKLEHADKVYWKDPPQWMKFEEWDRKVINTGIAMVEILEEVVRNGKKETLRVSRIPLFDENGKVFRILCIFEDITERLKIEAEMRQAGISRELSHCLKTCVAMLEGNISILSRKFGNEAAFTRLNGTLNYLKGAIDVALGFHRLGATDDSRVPISINGLLKHLVNEVVHDPRIYLVTSETDCVVLGKEFHFKNSLLEVISNARDFAKPGDMGGRIDIWTKSNNGSIEIHIKDDGEGVLPRLKEGNKLFELYSTGRANRTGIGLSYVMRVMLEHGGNIQLIDDQHEKGAHFLITMPIAREEINLKEIRCG